MRVTLPISSLSLFAPTIDFAPSVKRVWSCGMLDVRQELGRLFDSGREGQRQPAPMCPKSNFFDFFHKFDDSPRCCLSSNKG